MKSSLSYNFLDKAIKLYGELYSYERVKYLGSWEDVIITCLTHGDFSQKPGTFLSKYGGCKLCRAEVRNAKRRSGNFEIFLKKAYGLYSGRYDYSEVDYITSKIRIKIICKEHGKFYQAPFNHLYGDQGCKDCSRKERSLRSSFNFSDFVINAKKIHGDNYHYKLGKEIEIYCNDHGRVWIKNNLHLKGSGGCNSCKLEKRRSGLFSTFKEKAFKVHGSLYNYDDIIYKNSGIKVGIICNEHGKFYQTPKAHIVGFGCKLCGINSAANKNRDDFNEFIKKANEVHGDKYIYSEENYRGMSFLYRMSCAKHGIFEQTPTNHLRTHGCQKCGESIMLSKSHDRKYSNEEFISLARGIHQNLYEYPNLNYTSSKAKVIITCVNHGDFSQWPSDHLSGHGCADCKQSIGERSVFKFLKSRCLSFETQKKFSDCRNKRELKFDFYVKEHNLCIEYDGLQHITGWGGNEDSLSYIKKLDKIKNDYCEKFEINLLRISHFDLKNIEVILEEEFNKGNYYEQE